MKSWIEVSAERLQANYRAVKTAVGPAFEAVAVIKADAYGHGAALCAPVLAAGGARWFGVTDLEEGQRVRAALDAAGFGTDAARLLVMCGMEAEDAPGIVRAGLTPVIWTEEHLMALEQAAQAAGQRVAVHVEVDTGMARQGVPPGAALARLAEAFSRSRWVRCEGVFSHLSSSEVAGAVTTAEQERRFHRSLAEVFDSGLMPEYVHLANTSGVDEGSSLPWLQAATMSLGAGQQLMVRTGLGLYGYALEIEGVEPERVEAPDAMAGEPEAVVPSARVSPRAGESRLAAREDERRGALRAELVPVATWKTRVIGMREIAAGEPVGYGATFVSEQPMRLALLPVGYADGFRREASSGVGDGWVVIAGQRAPVVGRVSMNLTVVDVSGREDVKTGDEVVLLGEGVTAEDHAAWCGTIAYEILCGMRGHGVLC